MTFVQPPAINVSDVLPPHTNAHTRLELQEFWQGRANGECTTAIALEHVLQDLQTFGAPQALIKLAQSSIEDERRHTTWCVAMVQRLGGTPYRARVIGEKPLAFQGASESENALFRCIFTGCISETIALHVLRRSHSDITSAPIREVNRQHMAEEVNHARLGWAFLAWLQTVRALDSAMRASLERALPTLVDLSVQSWLGASREYNPELASVGAIQRSHVEIGVEEALRDVIIPGFAHYSVELQFVSPAAAL